MIFGIPLVSWITAVGMIATVFWMYFYIVYLFDIRKETDFGVYFRAMFSSFNNSELRVGWSSLVLAIEYALGLTIGTFIKSAWYPAQWTRKLVSFILFGKKRTDRIQREKFKDKPKKKKDNDGVY